MIDTNKVISNILNKRVIFGDRASKGKEKEMAYCDVCGQRDGVYYNKSNKSYMCDSCMDNHQYEGFSDKGWRRI